MRARMHARGREGGDRDPPSYLGADTGWRKEPHPQQRTSNYSPPKRMTGIMGRSEVGMPSITGPWSMLHHIIFGSGSSPQTGNISMCEGCEGLEGSECRTHLCWMFRPLMHGMRSILKATLICGVCHFYKNIQINKLHLEGQLCSINTVQCVIYAQWTSAWAFILPMRKMCKNCIKYVLPW